MSRSKIYLGVIWMSRKEVELSESTRSRLSRLTTLVRDFMEPIGIDRPATGDDGVDDVETLERSLNQLFHHVRVETAKLNAANDELKKEIGDYRDLKKQLAEEQFLLNTLMEHSPDDIFFKDKQSRFIRISKVLAGFFGLDDPAQAIGKSDVDFFDAEEAALYLADEQALMQAGQPLLDKEEKQHWPDGRLIWRSTSKVPLRDADGTIIGSFGMSRDITDRKFAEEASEAAKKAAEDANRAKSDFLANMSHEIRTPMNAVIGITELLLDMEQSATQRDYLQMVLESGENLLAILNEILDFSKIEAGKLELETAPFDLYEGLGNTMKTMGLRAHTKGLELAYQISPSVPKHLVGDVVRLRQIFVNLVGNAIKFTDQGEVVLTVQVESRENETVNLLFCVADTGIGIPKDRQKEVFESFEQADRSTTRRYGGTGLGLAICARLIDLMGGKIWLESEPGQGSKFFFTGQFQESHEPVEQVDARIDRDTPVLIVDDNATNRRILGDMLSNWGLKTNLASSAEEALAQLRRAKHASQPFDLVISDVNMPDVDGFSLAEEIRQDPELGNTKIMMLTSGDRPGDATRSGELGVACYLLKPVKQSELFNAVASCLQRNGANQENSRVTEGDVPTFDQPLHVLLAEDNLVNQKLATGLLERAGHHVQVVNNGVEAVAAVENERFDVVLMDVEMPEMDGHDATRAIRAKETGSNVHVPIIAMTAHAMQGDREACLNSGMDDYLAKPIRMKEMYALLKKMFDDV